MVGGSEWWEGGSGGREGVVGGSGGRKGMVEGSEWWEGGRNLESDRDGIYGDIETKKGSDKPVMTRL